MSASNAKRVCGFSSQDEICTACLVSRTVLPIVQLNSEEPVKIALITMFVALSAFAQAPSPTLPAACGPKDATFDVTLDDSRNAPARPQSGKALVYFIQDNGPEGDHQHFTTRIGMDGAWVGAYKSNSYLTVSVEPGEHHVCANIQSNSSFGANVALAHFTAEPGKTYYLRTRFVAGLTGLYTVPRYLELDQPDTDEAAYLIASYPLSIFRIKK